MRNPQPDDCPDMATTRVLVKWLVSNKPEPLVSVSVKFVKVEGEEEEVRGKGGAS